jgi:hypothetical protein
MARPRVFISSTFYDLKQVRADIDFFIESLGYDTVRNEEGDIPYGKDDILENYCYKEFKNIDILVCILGGRFGSELRTEETISVTHKELKTAIEEKKQVYIFIDKNVLSEYETYLINKDSNITYRYVDDKKIYEFIEDIKGLKVNNVISGFETASDIVRFLKVQFAGLFQKLLEQQKRENEVSLIKGLQKTVNTLNKLVTYLSDDNKDKEDEDELNRILMINHPLVEILKKELEIAYSFYFETLEDIEALLKARGFKFSDIYEDEEHIEMYLWEKIKKGKLYSLSFACKIFDDNDKLKFYKMGSPEWDESFVVFEEQEEDNDDLSF